MRDRHCRSCDYSERGCFVDVEIQAIIKQLKRKAYVLILDGDSVGFFSGKQRGEEMFALLEMLERALEKKDA